MESFFCKFVLQKYNLTHHDGRPLWKYNLTDQEFSQLKELLSNGNESVDPKDITLYYAEWWKNIYSGGKPNKEDVYSSLGNCPIDRDKFYALAKKGVEQLRIKWIQRQNRLSFMTLLLQGGLPINHLLSNSTTYTTFLKKVLEIRPTSINEFSHEYDIIKCLPFSSRNDTIYESCLQIVQAIWAGNEEYFAIFENRRTTSSSFKKITDELKIHKQEIEQSIKKRNRFKGYWIYRKDKAEIKLEFNFPKNIDKSTFNELFSNKNNLKPEYKLIIDDKLICKFKRNLQNDYLLFWYNKSSIYWNGQETKPDIYLSSSDGVRYDFPILIVDYPKLTAPTLWLPMTENEWLLVKGNNCKELKAAVLSPDNWKCENNFNINYITLHNSFMKWCEFSDKILLTENNGETLCFKTNSKSFNWFIYEDKPSWVLNSNIPIVGNNPKIEVFDDNNDIIQNAILTWRLKEEKAWNTWSNIFPIGYIEFKINVLESEEIDYFYFIGDINIRFNSSSSNKAEILINNAGNIKFDIIENELYILNHSGNKINIELIDPQKCPRSINAKITNHSQRKNLSLQIIPPFKGINLFDPNGSLFNYDEIILLNNLDGYRIIFSQNVKYSLTIYNENYKDIQITKQLVKNITPLREFEEIITKLFYLTDIMSNNSCVIIEFVEEESDIINSLRIKRHNEIINVFDHDPNIYLDNSLSTANICLYAVPLDCSEDNIELYELNKVDDHFEFPESVFLFLDKFIIFSKQNSAHDSITLPKFVYRETTGSIQQRKQTKSERINKFARDLENLEHKDSIWKKVNIYFNFCINYELPFSTFDILSAATSSPKLISRLFCFLSVFYQDSDSLLDCCIKLENEFGFSFHWISAKHWNAALEWVQKCFVDELTENDLNFITNKLSYNIFNLIKDNEPIDCFFQISEYIGGKDILTSNNFIINFEIQNLRRKLCVRVLNELPRICPKINDKYKNIIKVNVDNKIVKILLKAPVAVALSISNIDENIWGNDENNILIRRNIKYCQWIAPDWYSKAIIYSLIKLKDIH